MKGHSDLLVSQTEVRDQIEREDQETSRDLLIWRHLRRVA